jgi:hypothetical protein
VTFPVVRVVVDPPENALPHNFFVLHVQFIGLDYRLQLLYRQFQKFLALLRHFHEVALKEVTSVSLEVGAEVRPATARVRTDSESISFEL